VKSEDWDKLLEQGLSGEPPRTGFREEVLAESVAAFVRGRRRRVWRRVASLSAAAVLIAGVAFLLGRYSRAPAVAPVVAKTPGVTVPDDLVAWLNAAQLFRQLGMPDRVARAVDRANQLLPYDAAAGAVACSTAAPGCERERITPEGGGAAGTANATSRAAKPRFSILSALAFGATPLPLEPSSEENVSQVMAPALGD
jgi:hypothetical protein